MRRLVAFRPVAAKDARVLILGSMPGQASLVAGRYYAYPHNAFWPIMGELFGAGPELDYRSRLARLKRAKVALWDVLASCERRGSLDSNIDARSMVPNDFAAFLAKHPHIRHVCFNGATAERCFRLRVLPLLGEAGKALQLRRLPSTSPANASLSRPRKLAAWSVLKKLAAKPTSRA
jgi:TDG/mug DNA glycosylase family protein